MSTNQETRAHLVLLQLSGMRLIADPVQEISQLKQEIEDWYREYAVRFA
jgi:hypothetical protein